MNSNTPRSAAGMMTRRRALSLLIPAVASGCLIRPRQRLRLATFTADVTVPPGHGMMGGAWLSKSVADPLEANGFVLLGDSLPVVFVSVAPKS